MCCILFACVTRWYSSGGGGTYLVPTYSFHVFHLGRGIFWDSSVLRSQSNSGTFSFSGEEGGGGRYSVSNLGHLKSEVSHLGGGTIFSDSGKIFISGGEGGGVFCSQYRIGGILWDLDKNFNHSSRLMHNR